MLTVTEITKKQQIIPRMYRVTAMSSHDTITGVFSDDLLAFKYESQLWENGGIVSSSIDYADEAIDGVVIWKQYRKG